LCSSCSQTLSICIVPLWSIISHLTAYRFTTATLSYESYQKDSPVCCHHHHHHPPVLSSLFPIPNCSLLSDVFW
jgi:hypothetical protein